ncbi:MAG: sigma-70 family RNA polymerase sigma factor [Calditrichaceae bacterium]|nr:sigma-70 family RNA polymerase sigma factor [Calditrichaceae bacterium]MBN2709620.1 sigma-70 family RNA polymerase sigma factor [Calditrichaceae bacterium]RQV92417.1 MAG: sigma-70 family RNA polymerase sigma factor [Calditrichota bacterium]
MKKIWLKGDYRVIDRIRENDRTVLGELYIRYERMVERFIIKWGGQKEDAQDALQEAVITLWQKVCSNEFELKSQIGTYILGVAKNKWRSQRRVSNRFDRDADFEKHESAELNPMELYIEEESHHEVTDALKKISEQCRRLLLMFYFEGRSMHDIAALLNLSSPDVAKARKYQCKKELQKIMDYKLEGERF